MRITNRKPRDFEMRVRISEDGKKKIYDFFLDKYGTIKLARLIVWRNEEDLKKSKIQFLNQNPLGDFRTTRDIELADAVFEATAKIMSTAHYIIKYYREKGTSFGINQRYLIRDSEDNTSKAN